MALAALVACAGSSYAQVSPDGHTTEEEAVVAGPPLDPAKPGFLDLQAGPGQARVVRELTPGMALSGRDARRTSLAYFAQLSDFQLADEESPARVESFDPGASSAWRPQEALGLFGIDYAFRQINNFTAASPHLQAGGSQASMDFALTTGDNADSQQRNETVWVRRLIEGGQTLRPNSGVKGSYNDCGPLARAALKAREQQGLLANEPTYTGVADYDDHPFNTTAFYDPDEPAGQWADWPLYGGLLDRAQQPFTPVGLRRGADPVPTYLANGNHDSLVQGNEDAIAPFEEVATGCFKPFVPISTPPGSSDPPPSVLLNAITGFFVRPDQRRRYVDRPQLKSIYAAGIQADDHGFAHVDAAENAASNGAATYYAWNPKPGVRFVSIDTVSEGGVVERSSNGNIDHPQWLWLQNELDEAEAADEIVVLFGHHPVRTLTAEVPDELAAPCTVPDGHGHDVNPGCDLDPRASIPVHLGADLQALLAARPNVIAYVTGHTHANKVLPCASASGCPPGGNWWEVNTAAEIDWPQQSRLIEVMDNDDGTLSILGTLLDHASPYGVPAPTANASGFTTAELGSLSRAFSFNDPQADLAALGAPEDRNVELLVDDPRP